MEGIVTTSIGIGMAPWSTEITKLSIMKKADIALYESKANGRKLLKFIRNKYPAILFEIENSDIYISKKLQN